MKHTKRTPAEFGALDGVNARLKVAPGSLSSPVTAARLCEHAHWKRIDTGDVSVDDAVEYGTAFMVALTTESQNEGTETP